MPRLWTARPTSGYLLQALVAEATWTTPRPGVVTLDGQPYGEAVY